MNKPKGTTLVNYAIETAVKRTWVTCLKISCLILYEVAEWDKEGVLEFVKKFEEWVQAVNDKKPEAMELLDDVTKELDLKFEID